MQTEIAETRQPSAFRTHAFQTHDPRLEPIAAKVLAGQRLDFDEGLALYGSRDVLAVGWLANHVRERMHGDVTYFNVNRHINPTNVCVAACKLCAFGRKKGDPAGYTMALEEAFETAASGYSEAVTEFHIVGGLHPDLPFEYFLDLVSGLKQRFPKVHIKAFTMVEVAYLARRAKLTIEQTLKKLRANPAGKLLLVNFWATWCGPCVVEFPDLETTYRMFRMRDLEMVTVATNLPDEKPGVMKFLQKQHATGRNLIFASNDTYAMQAAFDPKWESGVPYTILLAPDGKVLYKQTGDLDVLALRRVILANLDDASYLGHRAYWASK